MSTPDIALGLLVMLAAVFGASCAESKKAPPAPPPPVVYVQSLAKQDLPVYSEVVAALDGYVNAEIRARVRGYLRSQEFKDGSFVKAGQLLFTIERTEYAAAAAAASATLARAKADHSHDQALFSRSEMLRQAGIASQQDLENAAASVESSRAQVASANAQIATAALNLSYTLLRAPISGIASIANVRVGNLVGQDGPTLLTTVSQVDPMRVTFPISEVEYVRHPERVEHLQSRDLAWATRQFAKLKADGHDEDGNPGVEVVLADGSVYPERGVIVAVNRAIDPSTGTIQLEALLPNPNAFLRPGQYGRVRLPQDEGQGVLAVPEKALISVQGTFSVAVVGNDDKVKVERVELGPSAQNLRIVRSGLREGDRIVVEGVQKISDGAKVVPRPAPPQTATALAPATSGSARAND